MNIMRGTTWGRTALSLLITGSIFLLNVPSSSVRGQSLIPRHVRFAPIEARSHRHASIITVNGPIDQITWASVKRRVEKAKKAGASLLILRINSTGGLLAPALATARLLRHVGLPTVAYVSGAALGPSLLIAASCQKIIMSSRALMGDGANFAITGSAGQRLAVNPDGASGNSVVRELQKAAIAGDHPLLILMGMVDRSVRVDEVENGVTGKKMFLTPQARRKLLMTIPTAGHSAAKWRFVRRVKKAGTLFTLNVHEARTMGLGAASADSAMQLRTALNITGAEMPVLRLDFLERLARWLATSGVRFFLFVIMLVCGYMEFAHPGITIPGGLALLALGLLVGGPMITGLADWWEVLVIALGVLIILLDIVHFGGLGLLAVPGFLLVLVGLVASFIPLGGGPLNIDGDMAGLRAGLTVTILGILSSGTVILLLMRYLNVTPGMRRFAMVPAKAPDMSRLYEKNAPYRDAVFVGAMGRVVTDLRPTGKARFGEELVDVTAENEYIADGSVVAISQIRENRIWVRVRDRG